MLLHHAPSARSVCAPASAAAHTAHAKAILLGEHSVVHGGPAIAFPVPALRITASARQSPGPIRIQSDYYSGPLATVPRFMIPPAVALVRTLERIGAPRRDLTVSVEGAIPTGRGLGSSAAVAAAVSGAVAAAHGVELHPELAFELVQTAERAAHGTPSGIDARAVISDAPILFSAGAVHALDVALDAVLVIGDTGVPGGTRAAVARVAARLQSEPRSVRSAFALIDAQTEAAVHDLATGRAEALGRRLTAAHEQLQLLGVSSDGLDALVEAALQAGALGAKLTGGGLGGCVMILSRPDQADELAEALRRRGAVSTWLLHTNTGTSTRRANR